jgi:hypothetical protein
LIAASLGSKRVSDAKTTLPSELFSLMTLRMPSAANARTQARQTVLTQGSNGYERIHFDF